MRKIFDKTIICDYYFPDDTENLNDVITYTGNCVDSNTLLQIYDKIKMEETQTGINLDLTKLTKMSWKMTLLQDLRSYLEINSDTELMNYIRNIQSRRDETITAFENALIDIITKLQVR